MKRQLFDQSILEKAKASAEEIEYAKKNGKFFRFTDCDWGGSISGYYLDGVSYITEISDNQVA